MRLNGRKQGYQQLILKELEHKYFQKADFNI